MVSSAPVNSSCDAHNALAGLKKGKTRSICSPGARANSVNLHFKRWAGLPAGLSVHAGACRGPERKILFFPTLGFEVGKRLFEAFLDLFGQLRLLHQLLAQIGGAGVDKLQ